MNFLIYLNWRIFEMFLISLRNHVLFVLNRSASPRVSNVPTTYVFCGEINIDMMPILSSDMLKVRTTQNVQK